jgi:hypothetical protein
VTRRAGRAGAPVATYLYCVVRSPRSPALDRAPAGLPGAGPPRPLPVGPGLWLVAADAPLARYSAARIEQGLRDLDWLSACAVAHDAVVEHVGRARPVVPLALFTLFAGDARAIAHIGRRRARLERVLDRVAGCREWGVRVGLDPRRAAVAARPRGRAGAGTRFLLARRAALRADRSRSTRATRAAARLYRRLAALSRDARRRPAPATGAGGAVVLDGAFLVERERAARFRSAVRAAGRELAGVGGVVTLTGPWPPYHFVSERR